MRRPVRSNNITNRKLFNNGGFPTMGAQAQMPNPLNVNMGGTLPQANNIMAPSGILASSTELSNAVGDQALAQSFAPTVGMKSGGIASFNEGGFGSRFKRMFVDLEGFKGPFSTSRNLYNKTLRDKNPDEQTKEFMENYEESLPKVESTVDNRTYGGNIGVLSSTLDTRTLNTDLDTVTGPMQTGSWLDENSIMTSERMFPAGQRRFAAGSRLMNPKSWEMVDRMWESDVPRSRIKELFMKTAAPIIGAGLEIGGTNYRVLENVWEVMTKQPDANGNRPKWNQTLAVADMVKQQPNYSQDITEYAANIINNNPDISSQDLIEQVAIALKTKQEISGNPIIGDLTRAADANRDAESAALEAGRTTLAEDIESGKASSQEIEDIINMKIDQSDPENQTKAMPPQSLIEEAYKRWENTGFSNEFITDVLQDENRPPEFINAVVNMRGEESEEGAGVPPTEQDGSPNLGTQVFRKDITSYAVGSEGKTLTKEEIEEKEKVKVINAQSGGDPDLNIAGSNKEELEAINKNLIEIDKRNKKGGQSQAVLEEDLGTTLATDIIKGDSEETKTATFERYAKLFKDSMGPYQGKSDYAKGMDLVALGAAIAGGESPNAMTNIANGITKTIDRFTEDDDARKQYNNQVRLSGGKFALTRMMKIEDEDRARDNTGQTLSQVDEKGNITTKFFTMNQIINGDSKGWTNDALTVSKLTYMGAVAKSANDLIPDPLTFKDSTAAQEKGAEAYNNYAKAVKGRLISMNALSMIHDEDKAKEIFGWKGALNEAKKMGKSFLGGKWEVEDEELFKGQLENYLKQYFQNLIPLSLGEAQSANSISNRDVEFLAQAYMEAGALKGGIFSFAFVNKDLLSQKLRAGLDTFVVSERNALQSFETTYNRLQGLQQTNKTAATQLLDQYTVIDAKTGLPRMRKKEDDELLVKAMEEADAATAPFLQFDSKTNTYYDPRTRP